MKSVGGNGALSVLPRTSRANHGLMTSASDPVSGVYKQRTNLCHATSDAVPMFFFKEPETIEHIVFLKQAPVTSGAQCLVATGLLNII